MSTSNSSNGRFIMNNRDLNIVKQNIFNNQVNLRYLNSGKNGAVYSILQDSNKVLKVTKSSSSELELAIEASKHDISPKIYKATSVGNYTAILMENMDGTLKDYLENNNFTKDVFDQIQGLITMLNRMNICHNDIHIKNIMYKMVNNKPVFKIIDFSRAYLKNKNNHCYRNMSKMGNLQRSIKKTRSPNRENVVRRPAIKLNFTS